jgi:hypothetical protein
MSDSRIVELGQIEDESGEIISHVSYAPEHHEFVDTILEALDEAIDIGPEEAHGLVETVNLDAVNRLFDWNEDQKSPLSCLVFEYQHYRIAVYSDGEVYVIEP